MQSWQWGVGKICGKAFAAMDRLRSVWGAAKAFLISCHS